MVTPSRRVKFFLTVGAIIVFVVLFSFYNTFKDNQAPIDFTGESLTVSTSTARVSVSEPQEFVVTIDPTKPISYQGISVGVLNADQKIISQVPPDRVTELKNELQKLSGAVAENPADIESWMRAAQMKIFFSDFAGARDIWEYLTLVASNDATAFYNLGSLYTLDLPDYPRAEENFKKAIQKDPDFLIAYAGLAELYRTFYAGKRAEAVTVLLQGLERKPGEQSFIVTIGRYYRDDGDTAGALQYFEKALAADPTNTTLKEEVERLNTGG